MNASGNRLERTVRTLVAALRALVYAGGWLAGALLLATTALIALEIVLRLGFGTSTQVAEEYSGYFLAAMIYLGAAHTLQRNEHIRVAFLQQRLGPRGRRWLERLALAAGLLFATLLTLAFAKLFGDSLRYDSRSFMPSRTPLAIPHAAVLAGAALLWLQFLAMFLGSWLPPRSQRPAAGGDGSRA